MAYLTIDGKLALYNGKPIIAPEGTAEPVLQEKTVTPTKSSQSITPDSSYNGLSKVTVNPIPDEYITTADATATQSDIASGKTAYVNGVKVTGTHECEGGGLIEVATESEMNSILAAATDANLNNVYKYTGTTTDNYTNDALYVIKKES